MKTIDPSIHAAEALVRASGLRESSRSPRHSIPCTVAISREVGALGTAVGREVGRRLGWPVYDHELLEMLANDLHVSVRRVEEVDERPGNWLLEFMEVFGGRQTVHEPTYSRHLVKTLFSLGDRGECVIVGRGAAHVLPAATTLRVRLLASLEDRVEVIRSHGGISRSEAARQVESTQNARTRFIRDHYRKDATDPQNYDVLLNSSRLSVVECADIIVEALRKLQVRVRTEYIEARTG